MPALRAKTLRTPDSLAIRSADPMPARIARASSVGFLTPDRRKADGTLLGTWARRAALLGLLTVSLSATPAPLWHAIDDIAKTAEQFLKQRMGAADGRTTLKASQLDPRLQLPHCEQPLGAFLQRGTRMSSRMTVGVRCEGARPWKVYVTVDVIVTEAVLVAAHSLSSGHVLTANDVTLAERDVSSLTAGYLSAPEDVLGRRLKHQLIEGRVLSPAMLKADIVIRRGQSVTLTIRSKSLNISMEGKALMDGSVNQRIRVENSLSRRVVEGIVRSPQHVEVLVF